MFAKCTVCKYDWNISVFTDLSKPYICPECTKRKNHPKPKKNTKVTKEHKDLVRNVLLRNKNKYFGGI